MLNFAVKDLQFGWRIPLSIPVVIGSCLALGTLLLPRSPRSHGHMYRASLSIISSLNRWLVKKHRDKQALKILTKIYTDPSRAQLQLDEIQSTIGSTKEPLKRTLKYIAQWKILQRYIL